LDRTEKSQLAASLLPDPTLSTGLAALLLFAVSDTGVIKQLEFQTGVIKHLEFQTWKG